MTTTEAWKIINEKEETELHFLVMICGHDADDLLYAINNVLNLPKTRMSPRYQRLLDIQTCIKNTQKSFEGRKR